MARYVKEEEYTERFNEILDAAQRLVYSVGYEQMTIQDVLDQLQISKGAFYHYFPSKQALLEALVLRTQREAEKVLQPIIDDPALPTLIKLEYFFSTIARWKTAQKDYLLALLRVYYADENAILRQKMFSAGAKWITPIFNQIIHQGIREGVIHTPFPEQVGEVAVSLMLDLGNSVAGMLLALENEPEKNCYQDWLKNMKNTIAAYTDAIERVLGLPGGSLTLFNVEILKEWVAPPVEQTGSQKE